MISLQAVEFNTNEACRAALSKALLAFQQVNVQGFCVAKGE